MAAHARTKHSNFFYAALACLLCLALMASIVAAALLVPMPVTVNGEQLSVRLNSSTEEAVAASSADVKPGNLLAIDGTLLEEGAGEPYSASINGQSVDDLAAPISVNSVIEVTNGADVTETFSEVEAELPAGAVIDGVGAVHLISQVAKNGTQTLKTGDISGITAGEPIEPATDAVCTRMNVDTGGEPIIALTFDDGPNSNYTPRILDVLRDNDAAATFFTVGNRITGENIAVLQRAAAEGHQIATHTYDHASGSGQGVNLGYMSAEEQVAEVQNGWNAIIENVGVQPSKFVRVPGGNFGESVIANLSPIIAGDIGWNIDTNDWQRPGVEAIKVQILSADPGDIILMHDGGGDRSQTAEALAQALPELVARGFRCVTIDELLGRVPVQQPM